MFISSMSKTLTDPFEGLKIFKSVERPVSGCTLLDDYGYLRWTALGGLGLSVVTGGLRPIVRVERYIDYGVMDSRVYREYDALLDGTRIEGPERIISQFVLNGGTFRFEHPLVFEDPAGGALKEERPEVRHPY